jgi:hypothetical protein
MVSPLGDSANPPIPTALAALFVAELTASAALCSPRYSAHDLEGGAELTEGASWIGSDPSDIYYMEELSFAGYGNIFL